MSSIVPGFQYDIFISYRHNDNRSGWVTDFVNALQEELAATIKEPLSIYFDKNPHDGLLETHSVDKSLEGKLKCLIFIPIISQTYCDPKSFAWQHEFVAFNKLSKEDQFGRDIKLSNGNVASRILPIKIHDLDAEDKAAIENEIGGVVRAVEFIFKSSGVNRPLTSSDKREENFGKTFYRDQINKTANAIKELVGTLKNPTSQTFPSESATTQIAKKSKMKMTILSGVFAVLALVAGYFLYTKFISSSGSKKIEDKSIAVLAFADLSEQGNLEYLGDGVAEEIINVLAQSKDLKVIARSSSFQFKGKNEDLREIGRKLGVSTILEGSVRKYKDQIRVTAQLIKVADGSHYWSKNVDQKTENLFDIQDAIASEVAGFLKATLLQGASSKENDVWNEEARKLYQKGRFFYDRSGDGDMERAVEFLQKSVSIDSSHTVSLCYLGAAYGNMGDTRNRDRAFSIAQRVDPTSPDLHAGQSAVDYLNLDFQKAFDELAEALLKGKSNPLVLRTAAYAFWLSGNSKQAAKFSRVAVEVDPLIGRSHIGLLQALWADNDYQGIIKASRKAVELFPQAQVFRSWHAKALSVNNQLDSATLEVKYISDPNFKWDVLRILYYQQKNYKKLDSLYRTVAPDKMDVAKQAEQLIVNNQREEAVKLLTDAKMDISLLTALRESPILKSLSGDQRIYALIKKFNIDYKLPLN